MSDETDIDLQDIRPAVAMVQSKQSLWIAGGVITCLAIALFAALEISRAERTQRTDFPAAADNSQMISAPAALDIPAEDPGFVYQLRPFQPLTPYAGVPVPQVAAPRQPAFVVREVPQAQLTPRTESLPQVYASPVPEQPSVVYKSADAKPDKPEAWSADAVATGNRTSAVKLTNLSMTVPQGTVIHAVLETALDSTRPGFARAILTRDVRGFDGSRVLIPRGSRLLGSYRSDLSQGQKRAFIQWERLVTPDGAAIAVNSPAADPLGRAGVGGKVNSHFTERFGGSLLQSSLDLGVALASQSAANGVVLALPGTALQRSLPSGEREIRPTLTTKQGTSVSVFVARDLDFSAVVK